MGPIRGPNVQAAIALPRFSWGMMSAIVPALRVKGQLPARPANKRNTTRAGRLGAIAHAALKTTKRALQTWYSGNLPYISESGAMISGPKP
jgi:hypothetical protein